MSITVDTTAPAAPTFTTTDTTTNDTPPIIIGTAEAGSTVELFNGDTSLGATTAAGTSGIFSITPSSELSEGLNSLTVTATDAINNVSAASGVLSITVDTTAPDQPAITTTTALTSDATPTIEGTAEAGSTVTLFVDVENTGITTTADGTTGSYTIAPSSSLPDGTHNLSVTATDKL